MKQHLSVAFVRCALLQALSPQWKYTVIPWICSAFVLILEGLQSCSSPWRDLPRSLLPAGLVAGHRGHLCPLLWLPQVPAGARPECHCLGCVGREFFLLFLVSVYKTKSFHCWNEQAVLDFGGTSIFPGKWALFPSSHLIIVPHTGRLSPEKSGKTALLFNESVRGVLLAQENDVRTLNELMYLLIGMRLLSSEPPALFGFVCLSW